MRPISGAAWCGAAGICTARVLRSNPKRRSVGLRRNRRADENKDSVGHIALNDSNEDSQLEIAETLEKNPSASKATSVFRRIFCFQVLLGTTLAICVLLTTSSAASGRLFGEGDSWWHIATGQNILSTWSLPRTDSYSFTAHGTPWMAYEWLGEVVMALAARWDSLQGLQILLVILAVVLVLLTYGYAWIRSGNPLASAAAVAILLQVEQPMFTLRPQLIGYIFLLLTLISLDLFKQGRLKSLWFLPLIFLFWVNTHGSFVLGFFFLGCY